MCVYLSHWFCLYSNTLECTDTQHSRLEVERYSRLTVNPPQGKHLIRDLWNLGTIGMHDRRTSQAPEGTVAGRDPQVQVRWAFIFRSYVVPTPELGGSLFSEALLPSQPPFCPVPVLTLLPCHHCKDISPVTFPSPLSAFFSLSTVWFPSASEHDFSILK